MAAEQQEVTTAAVEEVEVEEVGSRGPGELTTPSVGSQQQQQQAANEKERVLVTGGTGYIAAHIIDRLLKRGYAGE